MGRLDTKKLMRQCRKIAADQKAGDGAKKFAEEVIQIFEISPDTGKEIEDMDARAFEQYLTEFLQVMRESNKRYDVAVLAEAEPNMATQDILHAIELAPSTVDFASIIPLLHKLRTDRRVTKKELEVTTRIKEWYNKNEKCINELQNVLGDIRKILDRQPNDIYSWKTNVIGEKGQWLTADVVEEEPVSGEQVEGQLTLEEFQV